MTIGNYVEAKDSLVSVSGAYYIDMGKFGEKTLEIKKFNKYFFNSSIDLISYVIVVFEDYVNHCFKTDNNIGIIDFLSDSVKNNLSLNNHLKKSTFDVIENKVIIEEPKDLSNNNRCGILGELNFDNYSFILTYGGYYFIENLTDKNEQYFYYGD